MYCNALYCNLQQFIVLYYTVLSCTKLYCPTMNCKVLQCTVYCTVQPTVQHILNHLTMDYWITMEKYILQDKVHFLVNLRTCHARVLNWAIQENICPVELAQYGIFPYWASSTGRILSRIAQLGTGQLFVCLSGTMIGDRQCDCLT